MAESCMEARFTQLSGSLQILSTNISQSSNAFEVWCDNYYWFARNLLISLSVKEFWKSVSIWQSQRQQQSGTFFRTRCRKPSLEVAATTNQIHVASWHASI